MQVLDQKITVARALAKNRPHLIERARLHLATTLGLPRPAAAVAGPGRRDNAVAFIAAHPLSSGVRKRWRMRKDNPVGPIARSLLSIDQGTAVCNRI